MLKCCEVNIFQHDGENYETNVSRLADTSGRTIATLGKVIIERKREERGFVVWNEKGEVGRSVSTPDILESEGSSAREFASPRPSRRECIFVLLLEIHPFYYIYILRKNDNEKNCWIN